MIALLNNSVRADEPATKYSLQEDYATSLSVITSFFEEPVFTHSKHDQNSEGSCSDCCSAALFPSDLFIELSNLILYSIEHRKGDESYCLTSSVKNHISSLLVHPPQRHI